MNILPAEIIRVGFDNRGNSIDFVNHHDGWWLDCQEERLVSDEFVRRVFAAHFPIQVPAVFTGSVRADMFS